VNAADFNARFKVGDAIVHDPAPLLGEPIETCTVHAEAFDKDDGDPEFPVVLWTGVELRRPNGDIITAQTDHLRL
jgi:hypothetical protein